jgi:hypothetical protein
LSLCVALAAQIHTDFHKGRLAPRGGDKWGEEGRGERGDPRAGNAPSVGLGSKMEAVLTAREAAKELRGQGSRQEGRGTGGWDPCYQGMGEKSGARSCFLGEAGRGG